jgi:molecular chaperone DnaK (HSP70)
MIHSLGLAVGTTNIVAAAAEARPIVRRAVLTLFAHRPPEVGVPSENPSLTEQGVVLTGFAERVGDPVPLVASDGSTSLGEKLLVDALEAMARAVSPARPPKSISVAVPAHWGEGVVSTLRAAIASRAVLCPQGEPLPMVSDAVAALTGLQAQPGLPAQGIVALCDFGGKGTNITLADAAAGFRSVGPTVRYEDFSGDLIDQSVLRYVLANLDVDQSNRPAFAALSRVREQCRIAKERLSYDRSTAFAEPLPGAQSTVRITRGELEALVRDRLDGLIAVLEKTLQCNNIASTDLAALATVGGGAHIPLVSQRLSAAMRMPLVTTSQPQAIAAVGAARIGRRRPEDEVATAVATVPAGLPADTMACATAPASSAVPLAWSEDQSTDDITSGRY